MSAEKDAVAACAAACCGWDGCGAWVVQSGTGPSRDDQQCTATTTTCCWLKPNAHGPRTAQPNSTAGVVTATPQRPAGPAGPPPPPGPGSFSEGAGLLDSIAQVVESAGLGASAVPLSGVARRLAAAGPTPAALTELRAVLRAQTEPHAALLGAAAGAETLPAVCTFNSSAQ